MYRYGEVYFNNNPLRASKFAVSVEMVKWAKKEGYFAGRSYAAIHVVCLTAVHAGNVAVLRWMHKTTELTYYRIDARTTRVLQNFFGAGAGPAGRIRAAEYCKIAAFNGHQDVLHFLMSRAIDDGQFDYISSDLPNISGTAARAGHLNVLMLLFDGNVFKPDWVYSPPLLVCYMDIVHEATVRAADEAAAAGRLEILEWLRTHPMTRHTFLSRRVILTRRAKSRGQTRVVELLESAAHA